SWRDCFFQAEDGIRGFHVTGVQTCALPILRAKTVEFRERVATETAAGKPLAQVLDKLLPEAFAVCREGAKRVLGMRHFDVQLIEIGRASCRGRAWVSAAAA